ncbi:flagellin N-terminal helical domain-containing protein [Geoalkalibacter sp.]|uniref:flagellin N-terminal helical domain-containing protein n=1 Tax=Geoalkalibacter sp. TaxID=3041440 RepID=UPI00272E36E0|nr:hypothetical protein [Geoalkalibacter sp.]
MGLTINSNPVATKAQGSLSKALRDQNVAMRRLSSGLRINSAKDDAAGLSISDRLTTEIRSQQQVRRNIQDGLGYAQVGDTALKEIQELIHRGRELAVQAANATLSDSDRASLNEEFGQIKAQIDHIAENTEIFGKKPLSRDEGPPNIREIFNFSGNTLTNKTSGIVPMSYVPAGALNFQLTIDAIGWDDDIQIFTRDGKHLVGSNLADIVWAQNGINSPAQLEAAIFSSGKGFLSGAAYSDAHLNSGSATFQNPPTHTTSYNGMQLTFSGDADRTGALDGNNDGNVSGADRHETQLSQAKKIDKLL